MCEIKYLQHELLASWMNVVCVNMSRLIKHTNFIAPKLNKGNCFYKIKQPAPISEWIQVPPSAREGDLHLFSKMREKNCINLFAICNNWHIGNFWNLKFSKSKLAIWAQNCSYITISRLPPESFYNDEKATMVIYVVTWSLWETKLGRFTEPW